MKKEYHFLAFDIGATSGRSILGTLTGGKLELKELTRFPNKMIRIEDKFHWDIFALFESLKDGLRAAAALGVKPNSVGVDTWGVDFAYIGGDGSILNIPRAYRDPYTNGIPEEYFKIIPRDELYDLTGIEVMNFNSLFQLYAAKKENSSALTAAEHILFTPDVLSYLLTGKKICEYTIASTSQMINPRTKKVEKKLLEAIGLNPGLVPDLTMPGTVIGNLRGEIVRECGGGNAGSVSVIAVAGHDTASAVAAVPAIDGNFAFISSGTWSLLGIETEEPIITPESSKMNYTNEGGIEGTTHFMKNITGMWLLECCRKEWAVQGNAFSYSEIVKMAEFAEGFGLLIDPDDKSFSNPESMTGAIVAYCIRTNQKVPASHAEFVRCIFDSLALKYKSALDGLQKMAPFKIQRLHIIGGGSKNALLNQFTANSTGIPVIAGPSEATAIGNLLVQAKGLKVLDSLKEIREVVRNSVTLETFEPQDTALWHDAYLRFTKITGEMH